MGHGGETRALDLAVGAMTEKVLGGLRPGQVSRQSFILPIADASGNDHASSATSI